MEMVLANSISGRARRVYLQVHLGQGAQPQVDLARNN